MDEKIRISCEEAELFASMACDGECDKKSLELLDAHLAGCDACRRMIVGLSAVNDLVAYHVAAKRTPSIPDVTAAPAEKKIVSIGSYLKPIVYIAASVLLFVGGRYYGESEAERRYAELANLSPAYVVTTPTMWMASRPGSVVNAADMRTSPEKPFTDSIERYRAVIMDALRAENVNWMEIRRLVEAMGELRTDIELLTLHMAYLDIRTGASGQEVAAHWDRIGRSFQPGREKEAKP